MSDVIHELQSTESVNKESAVRSIYLDYSQDNTDKDIAPIHIFYGMYISLKKASCCFPTAIPVCTLEYFGRYTQHGLHIMTIGISLNVTKLSQPDNQIVI